MNNTPCRVLHIPQDELQSVSQHPQPRGSSPTPLWRKWSSCTLASGFVSQQHNSCFPLSSCKHLILWSSYASWNRAVPVFTCSSISSVIVSSLLQLSSRTGFEVSDPHFRPGHVIFVDALEKDRMHVPDHWHSHAMHEPPPATPALPLPPLPPSAPNPNTRGERAEMELSSSTSGTNAPCKSRRLS